MNKIWILLILAISVAGCGTPPAPTAEKGEEHTHEAGHEEGHVEGHVELDEAAQKVAGIKLATVEYRMLQDSLRVSGVVNSTATGRVVVTPPVAGRVTSISVQPGEMVRKGQTLAILESPELAQSWSSIADAQRLQDAAVAELNEARSEVDLAKAKVTASRANLSRQQELVKAGAFNQAPVQQAKNDLNDAQSELLSVQKEILGHTELTQRLENLFREGIVSRSELDAAKLELQQDQIRADRAKAKIANARLTFDREQNIASRGLLNARELQSATAEVRTSELELARAQIKVRSAEAAVSSAKKSVANAQSLYRSTAGAGGGTGGQIALVSPISGTLTHLDVTRGQAVDRTQTLMEIENLGSVWVTANLPEPDAAKIRPGASARITVSSLPGQSFEGIVQVIGSRVDAKTRSIPVQCLVAGAANRLKPNMFAEVHLALGRQVRAVAVPMTALVTEGRKSFVFVKEGEAFEKRAVTLGVEDGDYVQILVGLASGDSIAAAGSFVLASEQAKDELKGHDH